MYQSTVISNVPSVGKDKVSSDQRATSYIMCHGLQPDCGGSDSDISQDYDKHIDICVQTLLIEVTLKAAKQKERLFGLNEGDFIIV